MTPSSDDIQKLQKQLNVHKALFKPSKPARMRPDCRIQIRLKQGPLDMLHSRSQGLSRKMETQSKSPFDLNVDVIVLTAGRLVIVQWWTAGGSE